VVEVEVEQKAMNYLQMRTAVIFWWAGLMRAVAIWMGALKTQIVDHPMIFICNKKLKIHSSPTNREVEEVVAGVME
jgi:hypothetical protein